MNTRKIIIRPRHQQHRIKSQSSGLQNDLEIRRSHKTQTQARKTTNHSGEEQQIQLQIFFRLI